MIFTLQKLFSILFILAFFILPLFSSAQTATSSAPSPDTTTLIRQLQDLVSSLQKQIIELQTQLKAAQGEIQEVKEEVKELKLTRSLERGVKGEDVRELQEFLSTQYPDLYPAKQVTGFFGPATEAAIKKLQKQHGIESIGIVGPKTIAKLKELAASSFAKDSEDKKRAGESGKIPPGLLHATGIQSTTTQATTTPSRKLIICHISPGNPENKQTIEIDSSALNAHLGHGDTLGSCEVPPAPPPPLSATTTATTTPPTSISSSSPSSLSSRYKWSFSAKTNMLSSPAIGSDGTIYVMDGKLFAVTPTGNQKWVFSEEIHMGNSSPAIGSDGTIYINTHGPHKVYAINPNGTKKWEFFTSEVDTICCTPSLGQDGTIYITQYSRSGKLYALHPDGTQKWVFSADTGISFYDSAVGRDGTIYVRANGKLYAVNPDGTKKWSIVLELISSAPVIGADNTIYIQGAATLYAFNPDGTRKWTLIPDGKLFDGSPVVGPDGTIYARTSDCSHFGSLDGCIENLYAVNPNGTKKWLFTSLSNEHSESSPAIDANGVIYIGSGSNKFYAINPDGTKKWDFQISKAIDSIRSSPALAPDGTVYFSTFWGMYLYALSGESAGLANAPWPKFRSNSKNTGLVTSIYTSLQTPSPTPSPGATPPSTTTLPSPTPSPTPPPSPSPSPGGTSTTTTVTSNTTTDTIAPSVPTNLAAVAVSSNQINLSWTASTDNVKVTGYKIYRGGTQIVIDTIGTAESDVGLTAATSYSYTVAAYDAAGNVSVQSGPVSATTAVPPPPSSSVSLIADFTALSPVKLGDVAMNGSDFIVTDWDTGRLFRVTPGGQISTIASGFGRLFGVGVNGSDIFVSTKTGDLVRIASNGTTTTIAQGIVSSGFPFDIAFSGSDIIVADRDGGRLLRVTLDGVVSVIASGLINIKSVVASGQNFIISYSDSNGKTLLSRVDPNGTVSILWSDTTSTWGKGAFDALTIVGSDIFAFLGNDSSLYRFTQDGSFIAKEKMTNANGGSLQVLGLTTSGLDIVAADWLGRLLRITPGNIALAPSSSSLASILQSFSDALADIQRLIQKLLL